MELESDMEAEAERQYNQDTGDTIILTLDHGKSPKLRVFVFSQ